MLNFLVRPGHGRPAILNRRKTWRIRLLFAERTPLGYRAALTRDRWREIIRFKHPALAGHEAAVRDCLRDPDLVRESAQDPDVHLFYRRTGRNYLCVVTAGQETADRFVVTAYFTKNIKQGTQRIAFYRVVAQR